MAHLRSLPLSLWSHVNPPHGTLIDRCHQANNNITSRCIHMLWPFCLTCIVTNTQKDPITHPHTHTHKLTHSCPHIYCIPPWHRLTYTLATPLMCRRSHIETHAYQAPHPCRCSGACLASIPLSLHPSLASNPSLRRLPSVDQRCKTLPPAP